MTTVTIPTVVKFNNKIMKNFEVLSIVLNTNT